MITKNAIRVGIERNIIRFIVDPNLESGTVCAIGDYWFYFGGMTAEEEEPEEFLKNTDRDEVIDSIYDVLEDFRQQPDFQTEYAYYDAILAETNS